MTIGSGVAVTYTRHPTEMAATANFIHEISDGRFILGIGPGHGAILDQFGYTSEAPLGHMRRYVTEVRTAANDRPLPPIVFAALRKRMTALAGELSDGVLFANAARSHIPLSLEEIPQGKQGTFLVGNLAPAYVSEDRAEALAAVRRGMTNFMTLPNYQNYFIEAGYEDEVIQGRAALEADSQSQLEASISERMASDICVFGTPSDVQAQIIAFQEVGVDQIGLSTLFHTNNQAKAIARIAAAFD
jgi:alkanesulfonate monooxygenase SsuD/methylene tetrahydromethanopterin reductase-like flavin-dependent oxidoreductase (luciferase family)